VELEAAGRSQVLLVPDDGADPRVLVRAEPGQNLYMPRFSPDGRALSLTVVSGDEQSIRIFPAVGGRELVTLPNAQQGTWKDDDRLLFSRFEGEGAGLWEYRKGTGEERMLLPPDSERWWWQAESAPDGRLAVLGGPSDVQSGLYVTRGDGRPPEEWLAPGHRITGFGWAPGGRSLVASVDGTLARVDAAGAHALIPPVDALWAPAFAPDGTRMAVVRRWSRTDLVAVDPDGGDWVCAMCSVPDASWGSLGPAGEVAYGRRVGGQLQLMLRSPSGAERRLTAPDEEGSCPTFSPEGDRLAYLAREGGRPVELRVLALDGGRPVTLASGVEASEYPSWSPDGRRLTYAAGSPTGVWTVSAAGGEPRNVSPGGGDYPRWSPDGRWIAYVVWTDASDPDQGVWVVSPDEGPPRQIGELPTQLAWSPDGRYLWQLRRSGDELELWQAEAGLWQWSRRTVLDTGGIPPPYMENLPFTVDPVSGRPVLNRRMFTSELVVFSGIHPARWR
jgi:dipeptidyl aminopeptidase/acylaminoacyl peptidase